MAIQLGGGKHYDMCVIQTAYRWYNHTAQMALSPPSQLEYSSRQLANPSCAGQLKSAQ